MSSGLVAFTLLHVVLSLIGIAAGFVMIFGLLLAKRFSACAAIFLITTTATSVTGFLFPFHKFLPSHLLGFLSLIALALAGYAYYPRRLASGWRAVYVVAAVTAQYFNVFVLVAQCFRKVPALHALAPTQTETPFKVAQGCVLALFVLLAILSVRKFSRAQLRAA